MVAAKKKNGNVVKTRPSKMVGVNWCRISSINRVSITCGWCAFLASAVIRHQRSSEVEAVFP